MNLYCIYKREDKVPIHANLIYIESYLGFMRLMINVMNNVMDNNKFTKCLFIILSFFIMWEIINPVAIFSG